ncbi:hypothetical protein [Kitasatospora sp. NPDC056731]|uniref:hypothetical protein n=1 Tax=Kitasatospora sp. NPDC056731 TaxID=3155422 RepID=UPI00342C3176
MARPAFGYRILTGTLHPCRPISPATSPPGAASACAWSARRSRSRGSQVAKSYNEDDEDGKDGKGDEDGKGDDEDNEGLQQIR